MKFAVDLDSCENHGQCTYVAPAQFSLTDEGELALRQLATSEYVSPELSVAELESAEHAAGVCPMQAIRTFS